MTVPIPVLLERPSASSVSRERRVKDAAATYPLKSKFAQNLDRAIKKQNPPEVSEEIKSSLKTSAVESRAQLTTPPEKECQAKDAVSPGDLMTQEPGVNEDSPSNETELEAMTNQPVINGPVLTGVVNAQIDPKAAEGVNANPMVFMPLDQEAEGSEPEAISVIPQVMSDQSDDEAGTLIQAVNGKGTTSELSRKTGNDLPAETIPVNESGLQLNPNNDSVDDSNKKIDKQESGHVITKMPHEPAVNKNTMQVRGPEADKNSIISSPVGEKTETNIQTDVKKIMAMENHIRSGKVVMVKASGEKMEQNNSQSEQGQDSPKFNLLQNQTDNLQVRAATSKILEIPVKEQVDPKDLIQQIVKKADVMLKSDMSEIKMQLKPEFLGKMLIKVTVEEGTVVTKIITENQHVKQVLEANLNSLRQNLEANGMKVEKTEVSVQLFNDSGGSYNESDSNRYPLWSEQQGQNRRSYPDNSYGLPEMENLSDLPEETVKYGISSEGQVNYLI